MNDRDESRLAHVNQERVGGQVRYTVHTHTKIRTFCLFVHGLLHALSRIIGQTYHSWYLKSLPVVMLTGLQVRRGACVCASSCFHSAGLKGVGGLGSLIPKNEC